MTKPEIVDEFDYRFIGPEFDASARRRFLIARRDSAAHCACEDLLSDSPFGLEGAMRFARRFAEYEAQLERLRKYQDRRLEESIAARVARDAASVDD